MDSCALDGTRSEGRPPVASFWGAQLAGWGLFGLVYFLVMLPQSPGPPAVLLGFKAIWAASGIAVSSVLRAVYRSARLVDRPPGAAAALAVPLSALLGGLWVVGLGKVADAASGTPHLLYTASSFPFVALNHFLILLAWSGAYLTLGYRARSEEEARRTLAALGLARAAQLEMLRYQLNPHFLFNALNTVRALVLEDPPRARDVVGRLSEFLRYALDERAGTVVTLRDEIAIVEDYLAIEKVRFEERLDATVALDPDVADREIPIFLLHTLVENAVKHGTPRDGRLRVEVSARSAGAGLLLEVANSGRLGPRGPVQGVGLANVRRRLDGAFPGRASFTLEERDGCVLAAVRIEALPEGEASHA